MKEFTFTVQRDRVVTQKDIAYWVITAFEGGSTYWCDSAEAVARDKNGEWQALTGDAYDQYVENGIGPYANPEFWENGLRGYRLYDPCEEAWVPTVLTMASIRHALNNYQPPKKRGISQNWFRKVVDRLIDEDYDAGDADTIVQIAVFGEVVYG